MQLDLNLIYDKINKGIKDSVESLQDYPHELRLNDRRETIAEFFQQRLDYRRTIGDSRF